MWRRQIGPVQRRQGVRDTDGPSAGTQTTRDAALFYNAKIEDLGRNLKDLEAIVQAKSGNLRVVEDGRRACKSAGVVSS